jgi:hypothetical protein
MKTRIIKQIDTWNDGDKFVSYLPQWQFLGCIWINFSGDYNIHTLEKEYKCFNSLLETLTFLYSTYEQHEKKYPKLTKTTKEVLNVFSCKEDIKDIISKLERANE